VPLRHLIPSSTKPGDTALPYPRKTDHIARQAHGTFLYTVGAGLAGLILWSATTELDKVVRGSGRVIPTLQNQLVQHLEGGIVQEILIREGDSVQRGQVLMRIQNSFAQSEMQQARVEMAARRVRLARLDAETRGHEMFAVPADARAEAPQIVEREQSLFRSRADSLRENLAILSDQIRQKELDLSEFRSRWTMTTRERDLVRERVVSMRRLVQVGAVSRNELLDHERQLQQIEGRLSDLFHDIPRTEAALSEIQRRRQEAILRFRTDAEKEKGEMELAIAKLTEQIQAHMDRSQRSDVIAPIAGVVNRLHVNTVGGVVRGGEPLVQLVPSDMSISMEVKLAPNDRAEVWPGLPAVVKISAYDFSRYGGLKGRVVDISADALTDENGVPYFRVRLEAEAANFGPNRPVVPGMLADVDILSGRHTILDYILKPVRRVRDSALRQ
jgi:membrane fusion protein, adhesin transport system